VFISFPALKLFTWPPLSICISFTPCSCCARVSLRLWRTTFLPSGSLSPGSRCFFLFSPFPCRFLSTRTRLRGPPQFITLFFLSAIGAPYLSFQCTFSCHRLSSRAVCGDQDSLSPCRLSSIPCFLYSSTRCSPVSKLFVALQVGRVPPFAPTSFSIVDLSFFPFFAAAPRWARYA